MHADPSPAQNDSAVDHRAWGCFVTALSAARNPTFISHARCSKSRHSTKTFSISERSIRRRHSVPVRVCTCKLRAELLQQDSLIERVARKFHLERRPEFQPPASFLSKLRQDIRIVPVRNSRILQIVCDSRDAPLAADLANTLARTFIEQSIEARQRAARQTYESLRVQLQGLRPALLRKPPPAAQFVPVAARAPFLATMDANRRLYEEILQKANDARMASELRQSNIRLIGPAEPAGRPYTPNLPLNLIIGTLGGFVVAIGYVMLQEQNTSVLRSPGEAGMYLALPELGAIPRGVEEQRSSSPVGVVSGDGGVHPLGDP